MSVMREMGKNLEKPTSKPHGISVNLISSQTLSRCKVSRSGLLKATTAAARLQVLQVMDLGRPFRFLFKYQHSLELKGEFISKSNVNYVLNFM